jgi:mannosyltransferase OCH1-like enzyme
MSNAMKVIIMANNDDPTRVSIMCPTGDLPIEEIISRHVNQTMPFKVIDPKELPTEDDDYFEAWSLLPKMMGKNYTIWL